MTKLFLTVLSLLMAGCATSPVTVPCGDWRGCGTFVYERWGPPDKVASIHRDYPTKLKIHSAEFEGKPAFAFEIVSEHGGLPDNLTDETHLEFLLVETKRLSDSLVLYQLLGLDPESKDPPKRDDDAPPISASCIRTKEAVVLQIVYDNGFVDTFRFRGKGLTKSGSLAEDFEAIHWAETLYRVEPVDLMSHRVPYR